ncbi:MAG: hypothetical protein COB02_07000 [Candidatus Cloacimonadota bacterium]|nr:MAG: hypothetical protein COB02_07000 [Candidatus Cloacimonadota bacterium]
MGIVLQYFLTFFILSNFSIFCSEEVFFKEGRVLIKGKFREIKPFFLDTFEVNNQEYKKFLKISKFKFPTYMNIEGYNHNDQALVGIDWYESNLFCRFQGKRLPSYAELIFASQGESVQNFPFGNEFPSYQKAPFITEGYRPKFPLKVHQFKQFASLKGVFNLAGNIAEWTSNWVSKKKDKKIVYGGSYLSSIDQIKVGSFQGVYPNENTLKNIGFRCARTHSDTFEGSTLKEMAPEDLKALAFQDNISNKDFIRIKKKSIVKNLKNKEKRRDAEKQKLYLKKLLLSEFDKRKKSVSEVKTRTITNMISIPYGMFLFSANSAKNLSKNNLTYLDAFHIDEKLITIKDILTVKKQKDLTLIIPFSNSELTNPSLLARLSYKEANNYCLAIDKNLPTEAQWERAIKGNRQSNNYPSKSPLIGSFGLQLNSDQMGEWMLDYLNTYSKEQTFYKNPINKKGIFRYIKGPFQLSDYKTNLSRKIVAMPWTRANFRCVKTSNEVPNFKIDSINNYYYNDFLNNLKMKIELGENVFNLNPSSSEFEKKIEELDQELE